MPAMHTTLIEAEVKRIMGKVNKVWSQACIQFEIESIGPTNALPLPQEMRLKSGTTGFRLNEAEISIARKKAQEYLNR
jgi:hypothetical protein